MPRIHLTQVDSTSTYARQLISQGKELDDFTIVDADYQTGGRGQRGNTWESQSGKNLLFTIVCHPTFLPANRQFILSQAIALAVERTLSHRISEAEKPGSVANQSQMGHITVKWPNDIYWNDRKISGTLIECNLMGSQIKDCIVGTGININQTHFESDAPNPVSLQQIIGKGSDRGSILDEVANQFESLYEEIRQGNAQSIVSEYKSKLYRCTGFHPFAEPGRQPFEAQIADVDPSGYLTLQLRDGTQKRYEFKEVRFILQ